jgi:peptide/nickel transport system ATP-binding protein
MIFQDPATSFSPLLTIGAQLTDLLWRERTLTRAAKRAKILNMLGRVGIADPERRFNAYPDQLSGGMLQRVAIGAALLMAPKLLIADEPTTALDVTTEAQILVLLRDFARESRAAVLMITHHLGVVAQLCDRVVVMYAGTIVEAGPVEAIFAAPAHPYTRALLDCEPALLEGEPTRWPFIGGEVPGAGQRPTGCLFAPRCGRVGPDCAERPPIFDVGPDHAARCWRVGS